jgi:hypothetical protein
LEWTLYLRAPKGEIAIGAQLSPDLKYRTGGFFLEMPVGDSDTGVGAPREILGVTGGPEGDGRAATIRLQVPLTSIRQFTQVGTGTTWTDLTARSTVFHGGSPVPVDANYVTVGSGGGTGYQADIARSARRLVIGKPECISAPPRR